jgi:hypothetical protein
MKRVRVKHYGRIDHVTDQRLVQVPSIRDRQCLLHWAAASQLAAMQAECPHQIYVCSGWRRHRWRSWAHYVATLARRYTSRDEKARLSQERLRAVGLRNGRKWLAFDSPHETGLVVDIGSGGLWPARKTAAKQRRTALYGWLVENAHRWGWSNYSPEPWHWELPIDREVWLLAGPEG